MDRDFPLSYGAKQIKSVASVLAEENASKVGKIMKKFHFFSKEKVGKYKLRVWITDGEHTEFITLQMSTSNELIDFITSQTTVKQNKKKPGMIPPNV